VRTSIFLSSLLYYVNYFCKVSEKKIINANLYSIFFGGRFKEYKIFSKKLFFKDYLALLLKNYSILNVFKDSMKIPQIFS